MTKAAKTLSMGNSGKQSAVIGADDQRQKLDLSPSREAIEKIRRLEASFAMAEQNLGTLRVG